MKVEVTQLGFMKKLRYPGEVMDIPEKGFSKTWMRSLETVEAPTAVAPEEAPVKRSVGRPKKAP